jgi:hypothetical protein
MEVGFPRTGTWVTTRSQGRNRTVKYPIFAPGDPSPRPRHSKLPPMFRVPPRHRAIYAAVMVILPGLFYFVSFCLLTYPTVRLFSTAFFADPIDGLQNVWNLWWVNKAVTQLHVSPWHTTYLHYPYGTSLIGQTLNPFNGFLAIGLLRFLSLVQTYNFIVIFSYVAAGVTMLLLAYRVTHFYVGSMLAGYIYTFSNFHIIHTMGHLQLVSLEWLPLFILSFLLFVERPTASLALFSAFTLLLVLLCDYYYFFYCVLMAVILTIWRLTTHRDFSIATWRQYMVPIALFSIAAVVLTGPLVITLLLTNHTDPLSGYHDATAHSLDLVAPFIPNQGWRFSNLTAGYWSNLGSGENRIFLGISVTFMLIYVWFKRRRVTLLGKGAWFTAVIFFFVMSLGPVLHIWGKTVSLPIGLPYVLLGDIFPPLSVSGVPSRMIVITILSAAVIYAAGLQELLKSTGRPWIVAPVLFAILCVEYLPSDLATSQATVPGYVHALASFRHRGPVIDMVAGPGGGLYYQTIYDTPMAFGYISRTPSSVGLKDSELQLRVLEMRDDILYKQYGFHYLVVPPTDSFPFDPVVYADAGAKVYKLGSENRRVVIETPLRLLQGEGPVHEVLPHYSIGQTFTATRNGLSGVGLYLRLSGGPPVGPLVFHLRQGTRPVGGTDLTRTSTPMSAIAGGYLKVFTFAPLADSRGRRYYVYLSAPQASPAASMAPWGSTFNSYHGGTLVINHKKASGDLVMQLFYSRQSHRLPR